MNNSQIKNALTRTYMSKPESASKTCKLSLPNDVYAEITVVLSEASGNVSMIQCEYMSGQVVSQNSVSADSNAKYYIEIVDNKLVISSEKTITAVYIYNTPTEQNISVEYNNDIKNLNNNFNKAYLPSIITGSIDADAFSVNEFKANSINTNLIKIGQWKISKDNEAENPEYSINIGI